MKYCVIVFILVVYKKANPKTNTPSIYTALHFLYETGFPV